MSIIHIHMVRIPSRRFTRNCDNHLPWECFSYRFHEKFVNEYYCLPLSDERATREYAPPVLHLNPQKSEYYLFTRLQGKRPGYDNCKVQSLLLEKQTIVYHLSSCILLCASIFFLDFPIYLQSVYIHSNTISKLCVEKWGRVEECSVTPLRDKRVKTLCASNAVELHKKLYVVR
jgi:hypothetical protein